VDGHQGRGRVHADLTADISIDPSLPAPGAAAGSGRVHEVVAGDTLSKLAKRFYGDAQKYMKIFDANRDQLKDPNLIQPGQKLKIPE
jgi:nucleoid-associated protein YgaU